MRAPLPRLTATTLAFATLAAAQPPTPRTDTTPPATAAFDRVEPASGYDRAGTHHASCSGRVVAADGTPIVGARVGLFDYVPYYWALPVSRATTGDDGRFTLPAPHLGGDDLVWVASPADRPFACRWTDLTLVSGEHTDIGDVTLEVPATATHPPTTIAGRVLDAAGQPVVGAIVRAHGADDRFDPFAAAVTDADGNFSFVQSCGCRDQLELFVTDARFVFTHEAGRDEPDGYGSRWSIDLERDGGLVLGLKDFVTTIVGGGELPGVRLFNRRDAQLVPIDGTRVTLGGGDYRHATLVATRPGHLPVPFTIPHVTAPSWPEDGTFELRVATPNGPAAHATIDLCTTDGIRLETCTSDHEGRLHRRGDAARELLGHAYLPGHEPTRFHWRAGARAEVRLLPRDQARTLVLPASTKSVFVRKAGTFDSVFAHYLRGARECAVRLAAGHYEITAYGESDALAVAGVAIAAGGDERVPLAADRRPAVTVVLPAVAGDGDWWALGGPRLLGGMVSKWMAHSGRDRERRTRELVATVDAVEGAAGTFRLRFPISGRVFVQCGHESLPHRYFAVVDLQLGDDVTLTLPPLDARATGSMPEFPESWTLSPQHGIAGPRLVLRPDRSKGTTWGALVALPEPAQFTLEHLPAGDFVLGHHLYETGFLSAANGHHGERPCTLRGGEAIALGELTRDGETITVEVVGRDGKPLEGTLAVRDRMFESWWRVIEAGTTLRHAMDPIPTPPSRTLVDGKATFEWLRPARVEFTLTLGDGRAVYFERDLAGSGTRRIELDVPTAANPSTENR
jgi:hypothetical protein